MTRLFERIGQLEHSQKPNASICFLAGARAPRIKLSLLLLETPMRTDEVTSDGSIAFSLPLDVFAIAEIASQE